jgi:ATP-dependent Clp protease ATP-binding subunit ClpA
VNVSQKARLKNLGEDLKLTLFGQDQAVEALVNAIRLARSGLRSGDRPVGSFLFCGPTGVGKTELSKQLAHCLGVPFLRFDMSEYNEKHTISRLIGAPPGYVGFEQAGLLTDAVIKNPYSVLLLDEIEKAHSDIWNILLQVMDHGGLTDHNGRKADFRNMILVMTSNVGSRELERRRLGMGPDPVQSHFAQKAVEQTFTPEFRNRLDSIVYFNPLDPSTVIQVVAKQLAELESQLLAKQVDVEFSPEVKHFLAQKGYDRLMGARPLARMIQDQIKKVLSEEILFGKLEQGGKVKVFIREGQIAFEFIQKHPDLSRDTSRNVSRDASSSLSYWK